MSKVRVIQINESVFAENDRTAELIRIRLTDQGTLFLNFMSSPGSGKTTTLVALINRLKGRLNIGEMDVDIESSLDAQRVADRTGIRSLQIHNGGLCHIDADMTARALLEYDTKGLDLLILEVYRYLFSQTCTVLAVRAAVKTAVIVKMTLITLLHISISHPKEIGPSHICENRLLRSLTDHL